jgi:hypothetical protein
MNLKTIVPSSALVVSLLGAACDRRAETVPASTPAPSSTTTPTRTTDVPRTGAEPDNTAKNKVDRDGSTATPMDQSNSKADIDITASIRRAIMEDKSMSTNAQNVKIITAGGVTVLRGPVNTQAEKDAIEAKAKAVAGVTRVDNQIEVTNK